jgi:hypothetical protein
MVIGKEYDSMSMPWRGGDHRLSTPQLVAILCDETGAPPH